MTTRVKRALLLLVLAACTPDRGSVYTRSFALAEQAETRGRYADAATRYDEAAHAAKIPRDADHARYLQALMLEHAGDRSAANAAYEAIANASPPKEDSAAAAYRAADMRIVHGDAAEGWRDLEAMLRRFPGAGVARPALHRLVRHADDERGDAGSLEYLRGLETTLGTSDRAEEISYEIAVRLGRVGQAQAARDAFLRVAARWPYPKGLLFDDALYRASELDEELGRYDDAIADLRKMLAARESSVLIGSYERPRYDAAQLRIAELYEGRLHDDARARAALHELYTKFKTSLLREKALWEEAELWGKDGDAEHRCALLAKLVDDFPDSRYVACAKERCPKITVPRSSRAPNECRAYIERTEKR
jgi:tetratricopeptide (TPR) repeat protein